MSETPATVEFEQIRSATIADIGALEREVKLVYHELVLPRWGDPVWHGLPRTLYGYMMLTLSTVDLLSVFRHGLQDQTARMRSFLAGNMSYATLEAAVAVQLWRHTLMHTGSPSVVTERGTGERFRWLLHWGADHLPRDQHMHLVTGDGSRILGVGLEYLVQDLEVAARQLFSQAERDDNQRDEVVARHRLLEARQEFPA